MSHHYVAKLWRDNGLRPRRQGTFKVSRDPEFAAKVADIVGLYLDPPGGAVVLSIDEKTQIQALDRTQPLLPMTFDATEKRTHDYVRHGTTNLFAALNVGTGEVYGECKPTRNGADFLAFLKARTKPNAGRGHPRGPGQPVHPQHPRRPRLAGRQPARALPPHPDRIVLDQPIETWFGIITRQSIRRGTFTSVRALLNRIRDYITQWNTNPEPFVWTATADEILAKVRIVQTNIKKLVENNAK